jgi:hypothetical protein
VAYVERRRMTYKAPKHADYRCEDGHEFRSSGWEGEAPEMLPCPYLPQGSQDHCRKMGKRFYGRGD